MKISQCVKFQQEELNAVHLSGYYLNENQRKNTSTGLDGITQENLILGTEVLWIPLTSLKSSNNYWPEPESVSVQ